MLRSKTSRATLRECTLHCLLVVAMIMTSFHTLAAIEISHGISSELDTIAWNNGGKLPVWSQKQKMGGNYTTLISQIPQHWQRFGPETPNALSPILESLNLPLIAMHPQLDQPIPMLASHWFHDKEAHRVYYRIDERALWSDNIPVTSADIAFTLFFLTDPQHMTPYQHRLIDNTITRITIYDPSHFALDYRVDEHKKQSSSELFDDSSILYSLRPMPAHHYQSGYQLSHELGIRSTSATEQRWTDTFTDYPEPVTGPYEPISLSRDGIEFKRIESWWGEKQRYLADRFTLTKVTLIPSTAHAFKRFSEGSVELIESHNTNALQSSWLEKIANNYQISLASVELKFKDAATLTASPEVSAQDFKKLQEQLVALHLSRSNKHDHPDAKELTKPDTANELAVNLIYPFNEEFSWLNGVSNARGLSPKDFETAIETNRFQAALSISTSNNTEPEYADTREPFISLQGMDKSVAVVYDIPYHHYAFWDWVNVPKPELVDGDLRWFSPFDAVRGGMISIDRKRKAKILDKPNRSTQDMPGVIHYPVNQIQ